MGKGLERRVATHYQRPRMPDKGGWACPEDSRVLPTSCKQREWCAPVCVLERPLWWLGRGWAGEDGLVRMVPAQGGW